MQHEHDSPGAKLQLHRKCEAEKSIPAARSAKNDLNGLQRKEKPTETEKLAEPKKPKKKKPAASVRSCLSSCCLTCGRLRNRNICKKIVRPKQQALRTMRIWRMTVMAKASDPDEVYGEPEYLSEDDFDDKRDSK